MKKAIPALNEEGPQRLLSNRDDPLVVLERQTESGEERAFVLVNRHEHEPREAILDPYIEKGFALVDLPPGRHSTGVDLTGGTRLVVGPLEVRVLRNARVHPTLNAGRSLSGSRREQAAPSEPGYDLHVLWRPETRIAIEDVFPEIEGGRYPVKRVLGDEFEVQADVFCDGHDKLRAVVKFAPEGQAWREEPLVLFDNDRWVAHFRLDRLGLWRYTIEAWTDPFESWRDEFEKKREAGQSVELELVEGRAIVAAALRNAGSEDTAQIRKILRIFDGGDTARRTEVMLSTELRELSARCQMRNDSVRYPHELETVVDRKAARFAAW